MSVPLNSVTPDQSKQESAYLALADLLSCPACKHEEINWIISAAECFQCTNCQLEFPLFACGNAAIPWLFSNPNQSLLEWKARLNGFLYLNSVEQNQLKEALKDKLLSKVAQKRINKILHAKKQQSQQIVELIASFKLESIDFNTSNPLHALQAKVPKVQGLDSYYANIFRDWAWENGENLQMLQAIESVLEEHQPNGKVLTIGAGAGRLSFDFHRRYSPELSILMDINPLLSVVASKMLQGEELSLYEFPIAPLDKDSYAVSQKCQAPVTKDEYSRKNNLVVMLADGMQPPFNSNTFDTIITPWLIDIVPQNLRTIIQHMNRILNNGGVWLNTGSLAFAHQDPSWCYSEEEVLELIEKNGFQVMASNRMTIPYLQSPLSAHGRVEKVFNFSARKLKNCLSPPEYEYLPKWILDTNKQIPNHAGYAIESSKHLLQAQVIGAIDGNRTIEQISELVAQQYNLSIQEATLAVRRIMVDLFEENS